MVENTVSSAPDTALEVFLAWERLRVMYNVVLATLVLVGAGNDWNAPEFPWQLAYAAFLANVCFCLGPVAEGYLVLLRANRRVARWLVFVPGLLLACGLAAGWLSMWRLWAVS